MLTKREVVSATIETFPRTTPIGVAVIGCGLIGRRRANTAQQSGDAHVVVVADLDGARASSLADDLSCLSTVDWADAISRDDVDVVIVSTTNNWLAPVATAALNQGKHVLVEKPMARNLAEADAVVAAAGYTFSAGTAPRARVAGKPVAAVGFNHRYHSAIAKAHQLTEQDAIGDILTIRCRYGHGGRPGYGKEWRADPLVAGGGELLDQGIHAVDLFRWFAGDFADAVGFNGSYVWTAGTPVEDNAFALFRTTSGQVASLHASWTQWKNLFSFEIFGRNGYLVVEGLGGSYGPERLTWGRRRPESGPPIEESFDFDGADYSWLAEWRELVGALREGREPLATAWDGREAVRMVSAIYESVATGRVATLHDGSRGTDYRQKDAHFDG